MGTRRASKIKLAAGAILLASFVAAPLAIANDIADDWASTKMPAAPQLKSFKVDPQQTALLLLDFNTKNCSTTNRPRCFASLPNMAQLLADARSHGIMVVYSTGGNGSLQDVPSVLAPKSSDPVVRSGVDKFLGTDLEKILKDKGIHNVIVTGTSAHGAVLYTASAAALREFNVIVPVDGMSSDEPFAELSTVWILANAPASVSSHVTLTRTSLIGY